MSSGGHRNHVSIPQLLDAGIKILPHWNLTLPLWQFHKHIHIKGEGGACTETGCDCTHTCFPAWGQLFLPGNPLYFKYIPYTIKDIALYAIFVQRILSEFLSFTSVHFLQRVSEGGVNTKTRNSDGIMSWMRNESDIYCQEIDAPPCETVFDASSILKCPCKDPALLAC